MKEIALTRGVVALVDDADFEYLNQWKWFAITGHKNNFYAVRTNNKEKRRIYMHREILGLSNSNTSFVDHIDLNGLNNQRYNLREASATDNCANRTNFLGSFSSYKGVHWDSQRNKWKVYIVKKRIKKYLGRFENEVDAAIAYNKAAIETFGEFANLNAVPCGN